MHCQLVGLALATKPIKRGKSATESNNPVHADSQKTKTRPELSGQVSLCRAEYLERPACFNTRSMDTALRGFRVVETNQWQGCPEYELQTKLPHSLLKAVRELSRMHMQRAEVKIRLLKQSYWLDLPGRQQENHRPGNHGTNQESGEGNLMIICPSQRGAVSAKSAPVIGGTAPLPC